MFLYLVTFVLVVTRPRPLSHPVFEKSVVHKQTQGREVCSEFLGQTETHRRCVSHVSRLLQSGLDLSAVSGSGDLEELV